MTDDTDTDPEKLLQQSRHQRRTTTEPTASDDGDGQPTLQEAVTQAFADLEAGELNSTFGFRDERLVALLIGLERSGELTRVVRETEAALDSGPSPDSATRSAAASLLIRLGLQHLDEDILETGRAGYEAHLRSKAKEF